MAKGKHGGGKQPFFKDPEELQAKIEEYFEECKGEVLKDTFGNPMVDKFGNPIIYNARPLTTPGLAYHLGFRSRQSLYDYKAKPAFKSVIERAIMRIEVYTNERLFDKEGCNGAKFSLQYNFKGYEPEKEDKEAPVVNIICDIPKEAPKPQAVTENEEC